MRFPYFLVAILVLLSCCVDGAGEGMDCCDELGGGDVGYICENCGTSITYEMMKFSSFAVLENKSKADFCCFCCMLNHTAQKGNQSPISKAYVADYEALEWVAAQEAFYVKGSDISTPMDCGVVAFGDHENALRFKEEHGGEIVSFQELVGN
jgi:copper chaperone NosL